MQCPIINELVVFILETQVTQLKTARQQYARNTVDPIT